MAITIYKSQTVNEGAEAVLCALKNSKSGRRSIIIVPDAFTLSLETGVLSYLGKSGTFNIEVMSFARLAAVALGGDVRKCLSPSGCVMLMEKVVNANADSLVGYGNVARKRGFASEVYAAITSIRNSGVSPDMLKALIPTLTGGIKGKTFDIALLYEAYLAELSVNHTDSTTRLEAFASMLGAESEYADADYYIFDYCDFNAKQVEIIASLALHAASVSVACAASATADNGRIYPKVFNKLFAACTKAGAKVHIVEVPCCLGEAKRAACEELFSYNSYKYRGGESCGVSLYEAADVEEEITYIATEITKRVRGDGLRYRDFAVLAPEGERYLPALEKIFGAYEVPYFADNRQLLSAQTVFLHLVAALELKATGFSREAVEKYVLHPLFTVEGGDEAKYAFLDYTRKYGINHTRYTSAFALGAEGEADVAEGVRRALCSEVEVIAALPQTATVNAYAEALLRLWQSVNLDEKVAAYAEALYAADGKKESDCVKQAPERIMELLDTVRELLGAEAVSLSEFEELIKAGAEQVKIATIPVSADCVYFADVKQAMYSPIDTVFIIGASAGKFPVEETGSGIIGEREYTEWQRHNVVIEQTGVEKLGHGKFHALQTLIRAKHLYVGSSSKPCSEVIGQLRYLFDLDVTKVSDVLTPAESCPYTAAELVPTRGAAKLYLAKCAARYGANAMGSDEHALACALAEFMQCEFPPKPHQFSDYLQNADKVFFQSGATSISQLETYFKCPFRHFVQYGLSAQKVKDGKPTTEVGSIVHDCLLRYFTCKGKKPLPDDIIKELLDSPRYKYVVEAGGEGVRRHIVRECKAAVQTMEQFAAQSEFSIKAAEQGFGYADEKYPAVGLAGGVKLRGRVDRLDVQDGTNKAMVIDYKTYKSKEFTLSGVYHGTDLQLAVYLAAMKAAGYDAVAAFYARLGGGYSKQETAVFSGPMLCDERLFRAVDASLGEEDGKGAYLPLETEVRDGALGVKANPKFTLAAEELQAATDYAVAACGKAVEEIKDGYVGAVPVSGACEYCDFKAVCGRANKTKRTTPSKTAEDIVKAMGGGK